MRDLHSDYNEYSIRIDGHEMVFFCNSGLCLDRLPRSNPVSHSHYHNELFSVFKGKMQVVTDVGTEHIEAGESILIPRTLLHKTSYSDDILRLSIAFTRPSAKALRSPIHKRLSEISDEQAPIKFKNPHLSGAMMRIFQYLHGNFEFSDKLIEGCLSEISVLICQRDSENETDYPTSFSDSRNFRNYLIQQTFDYAFDIRRLPITPPTVEELSLSLHLSNKQTERIVFEFFGRSFREQVLYLRMQRAAQLLSTTDMTVGEIAAALGYSVTRSFFSSFRREFGMTPSEYRASVRSDPTDKK